METEWDIEEENIMKGSGVGMEGKIRICSCNL